MSFKTMQINLPFLTLLTCFITFGQAQNYDEKEILARQRIHTSKIIVALQNKNTESISSYFDTNITDLQSKLESSMSEIERFKKTTQLSVVVVFDKGAHIFRCRYSDEERARFQIDLYFQTDDPNSKVVGIKTKTDEVLKKEYTKRMKLSKTPPPPPKSKGR